MLLSSIFTHEWLECPFVVVYRLSQHDQSWKLARWLHKNHDLRDNMVGPATLAEVKKIEEAKYIPPSQLKEILDTKFEKNHMYQDIFNAKVKTMKELYGHSTEDAQRLVDILKLWRKRDRRVFMI